MSEVLGFRRAVLAVLAFLCLTPGLQAHEKPAAPAAAAEPSHLKIALVNMRCHFSDGPDVLANKANIQANLRRHFYFIDKLAVIGVEFIGFPELSVNGYHYSKDMTWLDLDGPEINALRRKAIEKKVYISVGLAIQDFQGKRWNVQIIIDPEGRIIGLHRKIWLASEHGWTAAGKDHDVFNVKGLKVGIAICADGTAKKNLDILVKNGAQLIYAPHASTCNGTTSGWYKFRSDWGGPNGWIAQLKVYAALHNQAATYNADFSPPAGPNLSAGWASGAWFIGPEGQTLAQMPPSANPADSTEHVLIHSIPLPRRK